IMDGLPGAVALRNITPLGTGMQFPEQTIEHATMLIPGMTAFGAAFGQVWLDLGKLFICQFVSAHQNTSCLSFLMRLYCTFPATASRLPDRIYLLADDSTID